MTNDASKLEKIKVWLTALAFVVPTIGGATALYVQGQKDFVQLKEQVNTLVVSNERNYEVFNKLAESVNSLSDSVARLEERTRSLERD